MWESWYLRVIFDDGQFGLVAQDEVSAVKQDGPEHGVVLGVLAQRGCLDGLEQLHAHPHLVAPDVGLRVQIEGEVALEQVAKAAQERLVPVGHERLFHPGLKRVEHFLQDGAGRALLARDSGVV